MDKKMRQFIKYLQGVLLSERERVLIRTQLEEFAEMHPVRVGQDARQHGGEGVTIWSFIISIINKPLRKQHMSAVAGIIIAVLLGGGTSVAAEQAVPGDFLYPVKTEVNENVRGAFAVGAEGKAKWDARLAERRLEEAERLAAEGRLNAEAKSSLQSRFEAHVARFDERADELEEEGGSSSAADVRSDLEARLEAHGNLISSIAVNIGARGDTEVRARVDELLTAVRARAASATQARVRAEANAEASARTQTAAEAKIATAERAVARAESTLAALSSEGRAELQADAEAQLAVAQENIVDAKAEVEAEAHARAFMLAQEAHRIATRILVFTQNKNVIDISLDAGIGIDADGRARSGAETTQDDTEDSAARRDAASSRDEDASQERRRDDSARIRADVEVEADANADVDGVGAEGDAGADARGRGILELGL